MNQTSCTAERGTKEATNLTLEAIANLISSNKVDRVLLFATSTECDGDYDHAEDGPHTNLPLIVALAEIRLPGVAAHYVVFDGMTLTARRSPRSEEVEHLLDVAVESGKVYFCTGRVPFTSRKDAALAAQSVLDVAVAPILLTTDSRNQYRKLL